MLVISRNLGRKERILYGMKPPAVFGSPNIISSSATFVKNFFKKNQNLAVLTLMPGPMVEATTQLLIY